MLKGVQAWACSNDEVRKTNQFNNYRQILAFVNATAWRSHCEDHHPGSVVGYIERNVACVTHAING